MRRLLICALLVGCSDSDPAAPITPTNNSINNPQTNNSSTNSPTNNGQTNNPQTNNPPNNQMMDMGADMVNNTDQGTSDMSDMSDMGDPPDMEAYVDPYPNRPLGQCVVDADCPENPNGKVCNRLLPGGSCGACDAANDLYCDDTCFSGTCVTTCQSNDDCAPGLGCSNGGRCGAVMCNNGQCPFPLFGCSSSNRCQRISCEDDPNVCPTGTECVSDLCVEVRMLP